MARLVGSARWLGSLARLVGSLARFGTGGLEAVGRMSCGLFDWFVSLFVGSLVWRFVCCGGLVNREIRRTFCAPL